MTYLSDKSKYSPRFPFCNVWVASLIAIIIYYLTAAYFPKLTPIITLPDGQVQGRVAYSRDGKEYWQFLSIPYAEAPLGKLRFAPPVPIKPWTGIKPTRTWPPFCVQFEVLVTQYVFGKEDCLFVNVNAPPFKKEGNKGSPVMIHIHGGGYMLGGSQLYGPDYLMDEELVVVTFNYRLGPFGFLNFEHDPQVDGIDLPRGNMGMKDQLLVLQWVQKNIANFGGDPERVTLIGESAGGVSVHLHILSQKSRGLFHSAISHSGSALNSWSFTMTPKQVAQNFTKKLSCPLDNNSELLDCLQKYDPWEMVSHQVCMTDTVLPKDLITPSVERVTGEDTFLSEHPIDILEGGNFSNVPFMLGINSAEGLLRTGRLEGIPESIALLRSNFTEIFSSALILEQIPNTVVKKARNFYFGNNGNYSDLDSQSFLDKMTLIFSDLLAIVPVHRSAIGHAKTGAPTYMFLYDYKPKLLPSGHSVYKGGYVKGDWLPTPIKFFLTVAVDWADEHLFGGKGGHEYGVSHGEEMYQIWNFYGISKFFNWFEQDFSKSFVKMIADFARLETKNKFQFLGTEWPNLADVNMNETQELRFMLIENSKVGRVIPVPFADRVRFWNSFGMKTIY